MPITFESLLPYLVAVIIGGGVGYTGRILIDRVILKRAKEEANQLISNAQQTIETQKREAILEGKDQLLNEKKEFEKEIKNQKHEILQLEKRILKKEENLERKIDSIEKKEQTLDKKEQEVANKEEEYNKFLSEFQQKLENLAGMTAQQAKETIISQIQKEAELEAQKYINKIEQEAKVTAEKEARKIVITSIQRIAPEVSQEASISSVSLPNDEMKGRIIGREGRNIRALEVLTGVDIIIDDTPEAIILSCFDPVRREKARISIERLVNDGRIHPARIEEVVFKVSNEIDKIIDEEGDKACFELNIQGMAPELKRYVGRLKYRFSYGQNILDHSKEVAKICGNIAYETGANVNQSVRGGLLHDLGKGVNTEEGDHARVGAEIARKYGEDDVIINSIAAHHFDVEPIALESLIVQTGDAISASRTGARRESFNDYIKRLTNLETIAYGFPGVEKAFAIQAGRKLRIIVNNDIIDDVEAKKTARDIAKRIEDEMKYPGQVRVALIRETRIIEYAR